MNKIVKVVGAGLLGVAGLAGAGIGYLFVAFPKVSEPRDLKIEPTDELRARGRYLAENVSQCIDCHSERDWTRFSGPAKKGTEGQGGQRFGHEMGFPGDLYASNITPANLARYSDGELVRTITEGVTKEGRPLFPLMPYLGVAKMCERDVNAVVVHIRSLAPIENAVPETRLDFPVNLVVRTIPTAAPDRPPCPDPKDRLAYGEDVATIPGGRDCPTPAEKGTPLPGMDLAGGFVFALPFGTVRSANITPDEETGIGKWDEKSFIAKFKSFTGEQPVVAEGAFNTVMPWAQYAGMTEDDLGAIYAYLRTAKPVSNKVERFTP